MYYGAIKNCDIANGIGVRVSLFVSGCTNRCPGCFQPETWSFTYGQPYTDETQKYILELLAPDYINGLTLLGGDPFEPENQRALLPLAREVKRALPQKTIWAYSGFVYEEMLKSGYHAHCEVTEELLAHIDVLVDGPYMEPLRDISLRFRGSANQRIIDMNRTRETGVVIRWDG